MGGNARLLPCALLLVLLCVATHLPGACCRGGGRGGGGRSSIGRSGGGGTAGTSHGHSAASVPCGRGVWSISGAAAALAAAVLVW